MNQSDIFSSGAQRLQMTDSIELTVQSLLAYGATHEYWGIAWSGGMDNSATLILITYLLDTGKIVRPEVADGVLRRHGGGGVRSVICTRSPPLLTFFAASCEF